jgi:hypothetical protein
MWSLGAVGIFEGKIVDTFTINLEDLEGSSGDPDTLKWWSAQDPKVLAAARENARPPGEAIREFTRWVDKLSNRCGQARPVCVAYPAGYDFLFVYWYIIRFGLKSPFSFSCLDMKTYAMAKLGVPYRQAVKKNMPKRWFQGLPEHTHKASDDALEQGLLFLNMLADGSGANT